MCSVTTDLHGQMPSLYEEGISSKSSLLKVWSVSSSMGTTRGWLEMQSHRPHPGSRGPACIFQRVQVHVQVRAASPDRTGLASRWRCASPSGLQTPMACELQLERGFSPGSSSPGLCCRTNLLSPPSLFPSAPCDQYPRPRDTNFSGLSLEEYKLILSTGMESTAAPLSGWFANESLCLSGQGELSNKIVLLDGKSCGIAHRKF